MIYPLRQPVIVAVLVCCLAVGLRAQDRCYDTHMEFFSEYSLGKNDELNRTFAKIQEKIPTINSVNWRVNDSTTYWVEGMKPTFHYLDSRQKAEITGNDTIIIDGGRLEATIDFTWRRVGNNITSGTGRAIGISDEIIFAKVLSLDKDYLTEYVSHYENVTFSQSAFRIVRVDPPTTPTEDVERMTRMFNDIINVTTVRHELEEEIGKSFFYYLNFSLYDDRKHLDTAFVYEWENRDTKQNASIPFEIHATYIDFEPAGLTYNEIAKIIDWPGWKCEFWGPHTHLNPAFYGGRQEFLSFDLYKNLVRYGAEKQLLDTELKKQTWESRFFQFFAGDLYEVIPQVAKQFLASEVATGNCKAAQSGVEVGKNTHTSFNVTINYDCELNLAKQKVAQFRVLLTLEVEGRADTSSLDFHVINFAHTTTFTPYQSFKVENQELAQHMVTHSLNRLLHARVFGSGWPLYTRDYPHFMVEQNYTVIYDSTHVDPDETTYLKLKTQYEEEWKRQKQKALETKK